MQYATSLFRDKSACVRKLASSEGIAEQSSHTWASRCYCDTCYYFLFGCKDSYCDSHGTPCPAVSFGARHFEVLRVMPDVICASIDRSTARPQSPTWSQSYIPHTACRPPPAPGRIMCGAPAITHVCTSKMYTREHTSAMPHGTLPTMSKSEKL